MVVVLVLPSDWRAEWRTASRTHWEGCCVVNPDSLRSLGGLFSFYCLG